MKWIVSTGQASDMLQNNYTSRKTKQELFAAAQHAERENQEQERVT